MGLLLTVDPQNGALPARDSSLPPLLEPPQERRWCRWLKLKIISQIFSLSRLGWLVQKRFSFIVPAPAVDDVIVIVVVIGKKKTRRAKEKFFSFSFCVFPFSKLSSSAPRK